MRSHTPRPGPRRRARARPALACFTFGLATSALAASCIDGTTPDCSDAAAQCGPNLDGSVDRQDVSQTLPEAAPETGGADAADDAEADAGDES